MLIPTGYAQCNIRFGGTGAPNGAEVALGLYVQEHGGSPGDVAADVRDVLVESGIMGSVPSTWNTRNILVKFGPSATGPSAELAVVIVGGSAGLAAPPQNSLLVRKTTLLGGRSGRGRIYWPGVQEAQVDQAGALAAPYREGLQTGFTAFHAGLNALSLPPVVLHGAGAPLTVPTPVANFIVDSRLATQRRRLRK